MTGKILMTLIEFIEDRLKLPKGSYTLDANDTLYSVIKDGKRVGRLIHYDGTSCRFVGRKPTAGNVKLAKITLRLTHEELEILRSRAKQNGLDLSEYIRQRLSLE
jgi:hypothetical protein